MKEEVKQLGALSGEALHRTAKQARGRLAESEYDLAACLLAIERSGYHRELGYGSAVHYATEQLALEGGKAAELLRTARILERLPLLAEAFRNARLGWGKIRELTRVATAKTEGIWLDFALTHSTDEVRRQVAMSPRDLKLLVRAEQEDDQEFPFGAEPEPSAEAVPEGGGLPLDPVASPPGRNGVMPDAGRVPDEPGDDEAPVGPKQPAAGRPARRRPANSRGGSSPPTAPGQGRPGGWDGAAEGPGYASSHNPEPELPLPLPGPKLVGVTLRFTPEEYALFEQAQRRVNSQKGRRVKREEAIAEMARQILAAAPARSQVRYQVIVHVDAATGQAWASTDRGLLVLPPEQRDQALDSGQILFDLGENRGNSGKRTRPEQLNRGKSPAEPAKHSGGKLDPRVPLATLRALFARAGGRCEKPGCGSTHLLQVHHDNPRCEGGDHALESIRLLCVACHSVRHDKDFKHKPGWRAARARRHKRKRPTG